jgi:hypothetical protein
LRPRRRERVPGSARHRAADAQAPPSGDEQGSPRAPPVNLLCRDCGSQRGGRRRSRDRSQAAVSAAAKRFPRLPLSRQRKSAAVGALRRARAGDGAHADEGRSDTGGGTVGVDIHEQSHGWGSQVIEFFAIGTAVIPDEDAEDHVIPDPTTVLDLA